MSAVLSVQGTHSIPAPIKKDMAQVFGNMVYSAEACAGSSTRQGHSKARDLVWAETGREAQPSEGCQLCHSQPDHTGGEGEHAVGR